MRVCGWLRDEDQSFELEDCAGHTRVCKFHRRGSLTYSHAYERLVGWTESDRNGYDEWLQQEEEDYLDYVAEQEYEGNFAFIRDPRFEPARLR